MMFEIKIINRQKGGLVTQFTVFILFLFFSKAHFSLAQNAELFLQQGHTDRVMCTAYSNNGEYIATGGMDQVIKLWEVKTGFLIRTFQGHQGMIYDLVFSPSDDFVYSTSYDDRSIRKWSVYKDEALSVFKSDKSGYGELGLSENGSYLFALTSDGLLKLETNELKEKQFLKLEETDNLLMDNQKGIVYVTIDPYGENELLSIDQTTVEAINKMKLSSSKMEYGDLYNQEIIFTDGKSILSLELELKKTKTLFSNFNSIVTCLKVNKKTGQIIIGLRDGKIFTADKSLNQLQMLDEGHMAMVNEIEFNKAGNRFISVSSDWSAILWDADNLKIVNRFAMKADHIIHLNQSDDPRYFVFSSGNQSVGNQIGTWDLLTGKTTFLNANLGFNEAFLEVSISKGNYSVSSISTSGIAYWYMFPSASQSVSHSIGGEEATCISLIPGGRTSCYGTDKGNLIVWRPDRDKKEEYKVSNDELKTLHYSKNGKLLIAGTSGGQLLLINGKTMLPIDSINTHGTNSGYMDKNWKVSYGQSMQIFIGGGNEQVVSSVSIADVAVFDTLLVATCGGNRISLVDLSKKEIRFHITEEQAGFASVDISPDGKFIVATGADALIHVYSVETGKKLYDLVGHQNEVRSVFFSPKQNFIISAGLDAQFKIWDLSTKKELLSFISANGGKDQLIYDQNGNYYGSKGATDLVSFRIGNKVVPFNRFDLKSNRPDLIMQKLSSYTSLELGKAVNPNLVKSLNQAYLKRLERLGITEKELLETKNLPVISIVNGNTILPQNSKELSLELEAFDEKFDLKTIQILINGVPLHGSEGFMLKDKRFKGEFKIELSNGDNRIEVYCINSIGIMSLTETLNIKSNFNVVSKTYYLGIGVSDYLDTNYRLKYARKDVEDMAAKLKNIDPQTQIQLLVDREVTKEKILALKGFLAKAGVNDKIIVHVSGHGLLSDELNYYFGTSDINFSDPQNRGLLIQDLEKLLDGIACRQKLLMIDACNSGEQDPPEPKSAQRVNVSEIGFATKGTSHLGQFNSFELMKEIFTDLQTSSGTTIIASSSGTYFSFESEEYKNGVFTYSVKEALDGMADQDNDKHVSIEELKTFVIRRVSELTKGKQQPTIRREMVGSNWNFY